MKVTGVDACVVELIAKIITILMTMKIHQIQITAIADIIDIDS